MQLTVFRGSSRLNSRHNLLAFFFFVFNPTFFTLTVYCTIHLHILLSRFYDLSSGSLSLEKEDIRGLNLPMLRSNLGIVSQVRGYQESQPAHAQVWPRRSIPGVSISVGLNLPKFRSSLKIVSQKQVQYIRGLNQPMLRSSLKIVSQVQIQYVYQGSQPAY